MDAPGGNPQDDSIADLVGRLIDNGRDVARAEIALYKAIARHRVARARKGLVLLVVAAVLGWFALVSLVIGSLLGLATLIGPLGAGVGIAALLAGVAYYAMRSGVAGVRALSGDEDEREALKRGETIP